MADDWYRRYPKDALNGMRRMTLEEIGAYNIILDTLYLYDRALPDDDRLMAHLLRCHVNKWKKIKARLTTLDRLRFVGGYIEDARWLEESSSRVSERLAKSEAGVKGGVASGISRKNKAESEAPVEAETNNIRREQKRTESKGSAQVATLPTPRVELEKVLDAEHAKALIDHRQKLRKPLTARAAELLAKKLAQAASPNDAADLMIEKGWHSYEPTWGAASKAKNSGGWIEPPGVRYARGANGEVLTDQFGAPVEEA